MKRNLLAGIALLAVAAAHSPALGCAACFGKSDSNMAYGMNAGIMTLLVVILGMLTLIASFFVFVVRRSGRMEASAETNPPAV